MTPKQRIRTEIGIRRKTLDPEWLASASKKVVDNLKRLEVLQKSESVGLYMPLPGEIDLEPLFDACWTAGIRTCMPVFDRERRMYAWAEVDAETHFETAYYGIREPVQFEWFPPESIDFAVVPGVAFDISGNRLGRGGGYYDRLLAAFCGTCAAVALEFQIYESIPVEPHDRPVGFLVTEKRIVEVINEH